MSLPTVSNHRPGNYSFIQPYAPLKTMYSLNVLPSIKSKTLKSYITCSVTSTKPFSSYSSWLCESACVPAHHGLDSCKALIASPLSIPVSSLKHPDFLNRNPFIMLLFSGALPVLFHVRGGDLENIWYSSSCPIVGYCVLICFQFSSWGRPLGWSLGDPTEIIPNSLSQLVTKTLNLSVLCFVFPLNSSLTV